MSLTKRIQDDVKAALKGGEKERLGTLRMLLSELKKVAIDTRAELSEEDEIAVVQRAVKQRREAAEAFTKGDRQELADKELAEAAILEAYLPEQLSDEELEAAVKGILAQTGASSPKDMGKVMGPLMARFKGRLDGNRARQAVQAALSS